MASYEGFLAWARDQIREGERQERESRAAPHNAWPLRRVRGVLWSSFDGFIKRG